MATLASRLEKIEEKVYGSANTELAAHNIKSIPSIRPRLLVLEAKVKDLEQVLEMRSRPESLFSVGTDCEVFHEDGRWHFARIDEVHPDDTFPYLVTTPSLGKTSRVPMEKVRQFSVDFSELRESMKAVKNLHRDRKNICRYDPSETALSTLAKWEIVRAREKQLLDTSALLRKVQSLQTAIDVRYEQYISESLPKLECVEARIDVSKPRLQRFHDSLSDILRQNAALMTVLNEKMVLWDQTICGLECRRQR